MIPVKVDTIVLTAGREIRSSKDEKFGSCSAQVVECEVSDSFYSSDSGSKCTTQHDAIGRHL